jgi:hypothetical protein
MTDATNGQANQADQPAPVAQHKGLEEMFSSLDARIAALENKPIASLTKEDIDKALSDHPEIARFRAFLAKWKIDV